MITNFQSPNLQREIMTKFEAPSCYNFRDIMITNFQSPTLRREIIRKKKITFFLNFHPWIYSSSSISRPSLKFLGVIVFEISLLTKLHS